MTISGLPPDQLPERGGEPQMPVSTVPIRAPYVTAPTDPVESAGAAAGNPLADTMRPDVQAAIAAAMSRQATHSSDVAPQGAVSGVPLDLPLVPSQTSQHTGGLGAGGDGD